MADAYLDARATTPPGERAGLALALIDARAAGLLRLASSPSSPRPIAS
jgi:hypothetical protein